MGIARANEVTIHAAGKDMSDIASELRDRSLRAEQEGEPLALLDEAADEIARLRLTDDERRAIRRAAAVADEMHDSRLKAALGGLLERTK